MKSPFLRFLMVGGVNTAVTYGAYLLLLRVLPYTLAYTIVYVGGILLAYLLQTRYVFDVRRSWSTFLKFPLVYLVQYGLGWLVLRIVVETGWASKQVALLIVLAVTVPAGFLLSRWLLAPRTAQP